MLHELICLVFFLNSLSSYTLNLNNEPTTRIRLETGQPSLQNVMSRKDWIIASQNHYYTMIDLLYPAGESIKIRQHLSTKHPIYNFLHTYYRYTTSDLLLYSPGINVLLYGVDNSDISKHLNNKYVNRDNIAIRKSIFYDVKKLTKKNMDMILNTYEILLQTSLRSPHYNCFGFHEWAMLYSGRLSNTQQLPKHQEHLPLRVSQDVIDNVVETESLRCTHFDAWRFFHPDAQSLNINSILSRSNQSLHEQPGCIHATMDLFKYAYLVYPLIPSNLLINSLIIAIKARVIDMKASPYDVSMFSQCNEAIPVETTEGKKQYIIEQENLYKLSFPIRLQLLNEYKNIIEMYNQNY